jgi:hypothetical protein
MPAGGTTDNQRNLVKGSNQLISIKNASKKLSAVDNLYLT